MSLQVCVSCVEPSSKRSRVCVRAVRLQESPGWAWVSQLQHCAADSAANLGLVSCVQSWIKTGSAEASRQNDRRTPTCVYWWHKMVQLARFGKFSVINSMGWGAGFNPSLEATGSWATSPTTPVLLSVQHGPCPSGLGGPPACCRGCHEVQGVGSCWRGNWTCPWALYLGLTLKPCPKSHR